MVGFHPRTNCSGSSCNNLSWLKASWPKPAICPLFRKKTKRKITLLRTELMFDCIGSGCWQRRLQPVTPLVPLARALGPPAHGSCPHVPKGWWGEDVELQPPPLASHCWLWAKRELNCQPGALSHPLAPGLLEVQRTEMKNSLCFPSRLELFLFLFSFLEFHFFHQAFRLSITGSKLWGCCN